MKGICADLKSIYGNKFKQFVSFESNSLIMRKLSEIKDKLDATSDGGFVKVVEVAKTQPNNSDDALSDDCGSDSDSDTFEKLDENELRDLDEELEEDRKKELALNKAQVERYIRDASDFDDLRDC